MRVSVRASVSASVRVRVRVRVRVKVRVGSHHTYYASTVHIVHTGWCLSYTYSTYSTYYVLTIHLLYVPAGASRTAPPPLGS